MANKNIKILNIKEAQQLNNFYTGNSSTGMFFIKDYLGIRRIALWMQAATVHDVYAVDENSLMRIPSMGLAGYISAGSSGCWSNWSNTLTATGGSTTSATITTSINNACLGRKIRWMSGSNVGLESTVLTVNIIPGGTNTLTFAALPNPVVNTDTFKCDTGIYYILNGSAANVARFKSIDPLTGVVTQLADNPASNIAYSSNLISTPSYVGYYATGTATSGEATTLTNSAKAWATNQWKNFQIRITAGLGIGQIRTISANDGTQITVSSAWATNPDNTSVYKIEANDDLLYFIGNNSVTVYRYSISANSWATLSPTVARSGSPGSGTGSLWAGKTGDSTWAVENSILDGRYIYSFRGGNVSTMDRYDIAGGTGTDGTWMNDITYLGKNEKFNTGTSYDIDDNLIYIKQNVSNYPARFFTYSVTGNNLYPLFYETIAESTQIDGNKMFIVKLTDGTTTVKWVYYNISSTALLRRFMII